jgi:hypothetical protein
MYIRCDVRQLEICTAEPLVPKRLRIEFKRVILCSELILNKIILYKLM